MTKLPASFWGRGLEIDDATLCRFVNLARCEDSPSLRSAIKTALIEYHDGLATSKAATTPKAVRAKISEIEKRSRALRDALDDLARDRGSEGAAENAYEMLEDRLSGGVSMHSAIYAVAFLHAAASASAAAVPQGRKGPNGYPYRATLICALRKICPDGGFVKSDAGYRGHFFDLVSEAIRLVEGRPPGDGAVGRAIEEALSPRLKNPTPKYGDRTAC